MNEWFETHPFLKQMRRRLSVELAVCLLLFCGVFLAARYAGLASAGADAVLGKKKPVVFLDAGHGDFDPGKVSVDGSLEKDINLAIAKRLKWYLEQSDVEVVMSREDDRGLYDTSTGSRKMSDMKTAAPASRNPARIWSSASTRTATTRRTYPARRYFITGSQRRGNGWRKYCRSASTMRWETRTAEKPNRMTAIISCSTSNVRLSSSSADFCLTGKRRHC